MNGKVFIQSSYEDFRIDRLQLWDRRGRFTEKNVKNLYIIAENHPWYYLFSPLMPIRELFQKGLKGEKAVIKSINPDTVFVEYCENWKLKDELKYRVPYLIEVEKRVGRNLTKELAREMIKKSYYARMDFYSEISKNSNLVFLEDRKNYQEAAKILTELERNPSHHNIQKFYANVEKRENGYYSKIRETHFEIGVAICGLKHVIRNGKITPWVERLAELYQVRIFKFDIEDYQFYAES